MAIQPLKPRASTPPWKRILRSILPQRVQDHLHELRALSGRERRAHLRNTIRRLMGTDAAVPPSLRAGDTVLFVCHGNIIRSALADQLMQHHAKALGVVCDRVISAGLDARPGRQADPRAIAAAELLGVDLRGHRAQPLTHELTEDAAVIYVMDRLNEARLLARFPGAARKLRRLGALAIADGDDTIADPYVLDAAAVAAVATRIDRATRELARELARRTDSRTAGSR